MPPGTFPDERDRVVRFAQMYPALRLHADCNEGLDFRYRQRDLMLAMDCAPPSVSLAWNLHRLWTQAQQQGCDVMLGGDFGNEGFSAAGQWGFVEYFLRFRWVQLLRALRGNHCDTRSLRRRFLTLTLAPILPRSIWLKAMGWWHGSINDPLLATGLSAEWVKGNQPIDMARSRGFDPVLRRRASRKSWWRSILIEDGQDAAELHQGLEQLYGITFRDPTAYRPLIEFCYGLPTDQFLRDGIDRWLARRMAEGRLPEAQWLDRDTGRHDVDWHLRLGRARHELIDELDRMAADEDIAAVVDLKGLRARLDDFPDESPPETTGAAQYRFAIPRGISAGRFIAYAKGRNDV